MRFSRYQSKEIANEAIKRNKSGETYQSICESYDISVTTLTNWLKRYGLFEIQPESHTTEEQIRITKEILNRQGAGEKQKSLLKEYGISETKLRVWTDRHRLEPYYYFYKSPNINLWQPTITDNKNDNANSTT